MGLAGTLSASITVHLPMLDAERQDVGAALVDAILARDEVGCAVRQGTLFNLQTLATFS